MCVGNQAARSHSFADGVPYLFSSGKRLSFILHDPECKLRHNQSLLQSIWSFSDLVGTPSPLSPGVWLLDPVSGISGVSTLILHLLNLPPSLTPSFSWKYHPLPLQARRRCFISYSKFCYVELYVQISELWFWYMKGSLDIFSLNHAWLLRCFSHSNAKKWQSELNNNFVFLAISALSLKQWNIDSVSSDIIQWASHFKRNLKLH